MNASEQKQISGFRKWLPVFVLGTALAIIIIDGTLLNVALSYLIRDLNTDIQSLQWVITAYALTVASLMITGGRLGDLFGRKKMFMLGAIVFAVGSFIASISHNSATLIAGESIIEGIGAAMMMPATASLLVSTYRGKDRAIAMGAWGGIAAAASAIGPILGGYLTTHYNWRWGFRINIFVVALLLIGSVAIKECRDREEKPSLDIPGVFLSSLGLLSLVFGIIESSQYGWIKAKQIFSVAGHSIDLGNYSIVLPSILLGIALIALFFFWEKKVVSAGNTPLVSMNLFKNAQFTSGVSMIAVMALGQTGIIFSIPVFLQAVRNLDAFHTGLAFLPMSLAALIMAPLSALFSRKYTPKLMVQIGLVSSTLALLLVRHTLNVNTTSADLIPGMILYGIGIGLMMAQLTNITLSAVSVEEAGEVSGLSNTFRQIGSALGAAVIGAALLSSLSVNLKNGIENSVVIPAQAKTQIEAQVASQTSNVEFAGGAKINQDVPPQIAEEIIRISHQATADSNKLALMYTFFFTALGFLISFLLPRSNNIETNKSAAAGH